MKRDWGRIAVYAGGFLGPFGGGVVTVLVPDLRNELDTSTAGAAAALTVYLIPFALLQLFSGTIGERRGLTTTIRSAFVVYAIASVGVALTSSLVPFLGLRALQGAANAFTTPLLVATLARMTAASALGSAMGTFASVQTAGVVFAPLVGGLAGAIDYRLAFLIPAVVALMLACARLPPDERHEKPPRLRSALTRRTVLLSIFAFLGYLSTVGLGVLVALRAADEFGLGAGARGLLLAGFGLAGVFAGRPIGRMIDRVGAIRVLVAGCTASAIVIPLVGLSPSVALLTVTWTAAGLASQMLWGTVYTLAVGAAPANQAGAISVVGACRFAGNALAPLVWLAAYHVEAWIPFVLAGAVMAVMAVGSRQFR